MNATNNHQFIQDGIKVIVTMTNGKQITGTIAGGRYNTVTFKKEYCVDYFKEDGREFTMLGIPESAINIMEG